MIKKIDIYFPNGTVDSLAASDANISSIREWGETIQIIFSDTKERVAYPRRWCVIYEYWNV